MNPGINTENNPKNNSLSVEQLKVLPPLKATINIKYAGFDFWKDKVWILSDQLLNKHYYLGRVEYEIINRWHLGDAKNIVSAVSLETVYKIDLKNIDTVFKFLLNNNLLQVSSGVLKSLAINKKNIYSVALKEISKIFSFKIPLFNPDKFLDHSKRVADIVLSKGFIYFITALFCANLYLLASNWGSFIASVPSLSSFLNVILILITIIFTKVIHELGHAYACKRYNCDVPEMGVNLIFFYPLAYTDVSSSIILAPQKRLIVSTAGIRFELYLAIIAGFFWFFCADDSIVKNLLFFIAAISWTLTLLINIMPFMRFDGYYILSDYLRIRNLGPRSAAVFKYYYRKVFLGISSALPEDYDRKKFRFLLIFAILAKIYRVFIFTSILLVLYYTQFIGSALFVLGLLLMLVLPIASEAYTVLKLYRSQKKMINNKNMRITMCIVAMALIFIFIPFGNYIYLPAVLHAKVQRIYTPFSSRVDEIKIKIGQEIKENDELLKLKSLELESQQKVNEFNTKAVEREVINSQVSQEKNKVIESKISEVKYQQTVAAGLAEKDGQLNIVAPINGRITAIYDGLYSGLWLADKTWLLDIVNLAEINVDAFARSDDLQNMKLTAKSAIVFIPDQFKIPVCELIFKSVATDPINKISNVPMVPLNLAESELVNSNLLLFASIYGGKINFNLDQNSNWVPVDSYFTVYLSASNQCQYSSQKIIKGVIKIKGYNKSIAQVVYTKIRDAFFT